MNTLLQDLRYGWRMLRLRPGFALVAVLSLALGIGANSAIFQLIDAVRLRTLPVKEPQQLAIVRISNFDWGQGNFSSEYSQLTFPLWQQIRDRQQGFSSIAVWGTQGLNLAPGGEIEKAKGIWVSGDFFRALGLAPYRGRLISSADDQPGCGAGGVDISYSFWQRHYGGDTAAIGKQIPLNGYPFTIIGVTPPGFYGVSVGDSFDVAIPVCSEPVLRGEDSQLKGRESWWLAAIGRLKPGWTVARATAQLEAISPAALNETIPSSYDAAGVKHYLAYKFGAFPAENGFSELRQGASAPLWLLLGISGLVLLIACTNLANLMLARATARQREIAVRLALGASRGRLIRQLLSESLLLAVIGAACGILVARILSQFLVSFISTSQNQIFLEMNRDWRVLGFIAALAILTTVLFGLAPAIRASSAEPGSVLKSDSRGMTASRQRYGLQRSLIVSQVALSLVLLVAALLFVRSLRNLLTLDPGFRANGVLVVDLDFARLQIPAAQRYAFEKNLLDRFRAIPGVESASASERVPISDNSSNDNVIGDTSDAQKGTTWLNWVSPGYFQTLQAPLLAGRDISDNDTATSPKVAVVNQAFGDKFLGGGNAVGKQFRLWESPGKPEPFYAVIGMVKNIKYQDLHDKFVPVAYLPATQMKDPFTEAMYLLRSHVGLSGLIESVKKTTAGVNPEIDLDFRSYPAQVRETLVQDELMATLSGFFGFLAALLAAIGLYGVISYMVAQRTGEIGIRMALGAMPGDVLRMMLREAGLLVLIGIVVGIGIALGAAQAASSLLFGLKPRDPLTLAMAVILLAVIALFASLLPARRASKLDPMVALRYE